MQTFMEENPNIPGYGGVSTQKPKGAKERAHGRVFHVFQNMWVKRILKRKIQKAF